MKVARVAVDGEVRAALVEGDEVAVLASEDVSEILMGDDQGRERVVSRLPLHSAQLLAPLAATAKFFCVGLNYYSHMEETGLTKPENPIIFSKFPSVLIGPTDDIKLPNTSEMIDWEVELGVVIGHAVREVSAQEAEAAIGGYTVVNDVSARDYQLHNSQWAPGKNLEGSTPVGPWIVSVDELGPDPDLRLSTRVDDEVRQDGRTSDKIFTPAEVISYISEFITLQPGDVIATGSCAGVGHLMDPPMYLGAGMTLESEIEGVGTLRNLCVAGRVSRLTASAAA